MKRLLLALLFWQASVPRAGIEGIVIKSPANAQEPLPNARVELIGRSGEALIARTDGGGHFSFTSLPAGTYWLAVTRDGYLRQEYGQADRRAPAMPLILEAGQQRKDIVFALEPAATISGVVHNEDEEPIGNLLIQALRPAYGIRGERIFSPVVSTLTDDRGAFRLYWLDPGEYLIAADYLPRLPSAVNPDDDAPRAAYAPTYYPGSLDVSLAQTVRVDADGRDVAGAMIRLTRAPAVTVRGTTYDVATRMAIPATVTLSRVGDRPETTSVTVSSNAQGAFEFRNVVQGSYIVVASDAAKNMGLARVTIRASQDTTGLQIGLRPGITIYGRVTSATAVNVGALQVTIAPIEPQLNAGLAKLQSNGVFTISDVQPGGYLVTVTGAPDDVYFKVARSGRTDLPNDLLQVQGGAAEPLEIVLGTDGGRLTGAVIDDADHAYTGAQVVLVPDPARRGRPGQYRIAMSDSAGLFSMRAIPPGDYKLLAWTAIAPRAYLNAEYLNSYENSGTPLRIRAGENPAVSTRVITTTP